MCFPMCGAKGEGIQCRTEDPETQGGEDHGYLERGSRGDEVGEMKKGERGGQFTPNGEVDLLMGCRPRLWKTLVNCSPENIHVNNIWEFSLVISVVYGQFIFKTNLQISMK